MAKKKKGLANEENGLNKEIIEGAFKKYKELRDEPNARALSWEHCIAQFDAAFANPEKSASDGKTLDQLSLHLGFYLASWGMMRGSTALLQYDYKVHVPAVEAVLKHHSLYGKDLDVLCEQQDEIASLCNDIRDAYTKKDKQRRPLGIVSDILVSKIILGTLGITPAYDMNVSAAVKKYGISVGTFSPKSFKELAHYFTENYADITARMTEEMKKKCPLYTRAKVIDGILWVLGLDA